MQERRRRACHGRVQRLCAQRCKGIRESDMNSRFVLFVAAFEIQNAASGRLILVRHGSSECGASIVSADPRSLGPRAGAGHRWEPSGRGRLEVMQGRGAMRELGVGCDQPSRGAAFCA